jgi:hypothetical protein
MARSLWFCCSFATPIWSGRRRGMTQRRQAVQVSRDQSFKGRQFTAEVILWAIRWYLMFPISYRDLELVLLDRGVRVDHTTIFRWIQAYAVELEKRLRPHLRVSNGSWRVDETYGKVKGRWQRGAWIVATTSRASSTRSPTGLPTRLACVSAAA